MADTQKPKAVVVDTSRSPHARLRPVPVDAVTLTDDFWAPRLRINREVTLRDQHRSLEETGRIENFRRAAGKKSVAFQGIFFNDSDVYKWVEAAAWALASGDDPALRKLVDDTVAEIEAAQQKDGYLGTYFMFEHAGERFTNLRDMHELYCAGHLIQAAVAHYRATGSDRLLNVARRLADHICGVFGRGQGQREGACGHPEIEMALVELARTTGDTKYLDEAQFLVDCRGKGLLGGDDYRQDRVPFRQLDRMVGHAVRAVYLNAGATDIYAETGEAALREAVDRMWLNMTACQMYVTGSVGSRYEGEAFGKDYELPNERAYSETCAAIGSIMWNWRMLSLRGDPRYADALEIALYNGFLSSLSLDGKTYFYMNPLADDGTSRRTPWFHCACCPPNIARMIASLPGYFYSTSDEGIWVHLYASNKAQVTLSDGRAVQITQRTRYPWDGGIEIEVDGEGEFCLFLRVPVWAGSETAICPPDEVSFQLLEEGTYAKVRRTWKRGDKVTLSMPMRAYRVVAHPHVAEDLSRVAFMRGPLLYCVEQADNPGVDPRDVVLAGESAVMETSFHKDLLGGVVVLSCEAYNRPPSDGWRNRLYRFRGGSEEASMSGLRAVSRHGAEVVAIPYYAWANREPGRMQVWLRRY